MEVLGLYSSIQELPISVVAEYGSDRFNQFLDLLGDEVQLRGWQQFKGGLDNKSKYRTPCSNNGGKLGKTADK